MSDYEVLFLAPVVSILGALGWFVRGLRQNQIKNNKYCEKMCLEVVGAGIVGCAFGLICANIFRSQFVTLLIVFILGSGWQILLQSCRAKITTILEKILGNANLEDKE